MSTTDQLTRHFGLSELIRSQTALRRGIDNYPTASALANLRNILAPGLQRVRDLLGAPMHITSGYRSPALNAVIGGSNNSQHTQGLAADFVAPGFGSPRAVARYIATHPDIEFDQVIFEGTWVHLSFAGFAARARREPLTAHFTQAGAVTYTHGIA
jgi:zinc D-Ala-D-Ala carboxypeptidase